MPFPWAALAIAGMAGAAALTGVPGAAAGRSRPTSEATCGSGQPRTEGPYVTSGGPDDDYTRDGCYAIVGQSVIRRATDGRTRWTRALAGELGGVRPPHILHDAARVYVAHGDGVTALDVAAGSIVWHSAGPRERMRLRDTLLLATECGSSQAIQAGGRFVVARSVADGRTIFKVRLPAAFTDPWPIREFGGWFVAQDGDAADDSIGAVIFDATGRVRYRLAKLLVGGTRQGNDVVLLTVGEVARLAPSGAVRWSFPSVYSGNGDTVGGGMVTLPGGDLVEYEYDSISDSGVGLQRFDPAHGTRRWAADCKALGVSHSLYQHHATVAVDGSQLRVTSRGSYGTFVEWLDLATGKQVRRIQE